MKSPISSLDTDKLSFYRTKHHFEKYGEFHTVDEFIQYCQWAQQRDVPLYILGNGSNVLFKSRKISSLVLKNKLNKDIKPLGEGRFEISSSTQVIDVLRYCYAQSLESFYYLSSVPATIGGALAMNAGRGRQQNMTVYDFVESVTFFDFEQNQIKTLLPNEIVQGYRQTTFTGIQKKLILKAIFKFESISFQSDPILERKKWSKEFQDYSAPNCGSVFKQADYRILRKLEGLSIGQSAFSKKTTNWILNKSKSSLPIRFLISMAQILHAFLGKKIELEVIVIE
ncbi:FAD-binding protein [Leptolyngbyaceae cyanobacterium CCMR0082]|uniref:UDP-N-acetylenolpyruvoylglucosamine reductase n=1 Tax=Adonisia turfae CCMR0082 TaxID=2304604 RepID=A0A6M0SJD9_9CYAN|nr:FAD-binding protein [Adonisia turfae]NEZ67652.1 FAD-binding protein [Adonisia turfae CCMR0082]